MFVSSHQRIHNARLTRVFQSVESEANGTVKNVGLKLFPSFSAY